MTSKSARFRFDLYIWLLLVIIALGIILRLLYLSRAMFYDEALTYLEYGTISLTRVLGRYNTPNNHILHSVAVWFSTRAFDSFAPYAVRAPAFLFGVLMIPLTYMVGTQFFVKRAALLAAGLVAVLLPLIDYSVNARGYTIQLCILLAMFGAAHHLKTHNRWWLWALFAALAALGFWTIPVMVYPMGVIVVWLAMSIWVENKGKARRNLLIGLMAALIGGGVLTLILYLPVFTTFGVRALLANDFVRFRAIDDPTVISTAPQVTSTPLGIIKTPLLISFERLWDLVSITLPVPLVLVLSMGVIVSTLAHRRVAVAHRVPIMLAFFAWVIPFLLVYPVVAPQRQWLFTLPLLCWLSAAGIVVLIDAAIARLRRLPAARPSISDPTDRSSLAVWLLISVIVIGAAALATVSNRDTLYNFQTGSSPDAPAVAAQLLRVMSADDMLLTEVPHSAPIGYYMKLYAGLREPRSEAIYNHFDSYPYFLRDAVGRRVFAYEDAVEEVNSVLSTFYLDGTGLSIMLQPITDYGIMSLIEIEYDAEIPGLILLDEPFDTLANTPDSFLFNQRYTFVQIVDDAGAVGGALQNTIREQTSIFGDERGAYWTDVHVDVRLQVTTHANDSAPDVIIAGRGVRGDDEIYREIGVALDSDDKTAALVVLENGVITANLTSVPLDITLNAWVTARVDFIGERVALSIDDTLIVSANDARFPRGQVRVLIPPSGQINLDHLTITTAYE